jgi:hypothetical protein
MKQNKYKLMAAIALVALTSSMLTMAFLPKGGKSLADGQVINANVDIKAWRPDGTVILEQTIHNAITNVTRNNTALCLMKGLNCSYIQNFSYIALGNGTTANGDGVTVLGGEVAAADGSGLDRVNASVVYIINTSQVYNVSVTYTWTTVGAAVEVNRTALYNNSSGATPALAVANFTKVNLTAGDKINVTWWITVG